MSGTRRLTIIPASATVLILLAAGAAHAQTSNTATPAVADVAQLPTLTPPPPSAAPAPMTPMPQPVTGAPAAPPALTAQDTINDQKKSDPAVAAPPADAAGAVSGPTRPLQAQKGDDTYYDSHATVPSKQMSSVVGPRKVNPSVEPGQAFVIVEGVKKANGKEAMVTAADRALASDMNDSALSMYNNLAKKSPRDPHILMGRAVAEQKLGMNDAAIEGYNQVLSVSPDNIDAMVNMLGLLKQKDPQGALQHMIALDRRFPDDAGLAAQTGMAEGEAGNYADAMRYLGKASALQPENPQHSFNMAVLADREGDTANAAKYYQLALKQSADVETGGVDRGVVEKRLAALSRN